MAPEQIVPGLYQLSLGIVNAYLLISSKPGGGEELVLIDTGTAGNEDIILSGIRDIGRSPEDLRHILLTHCHYDHVGSAAALVKATGALVHMHRMDAELFRQGRGMRDSFGPGPGLLNQLIFHTMAAGGNAEVMPTPVDHFLEHGEILPLAGDIEVFHAPGHSAGQVALLWRRYKGVLFAADTASNLGGLRYSIGYEDLIQGERTLAFLGTLNFDIALFGHGKPIMQAANLRFRTKWNSSPKKG